ncbi:MAG: dihydrolipoyl dehydrogenase [Desulfurococcaceae archaeon]
MKYDVVVIGSGIGGYPAAIYLADRGYRVAVVEKHFIGGECTNYGCVPSKAFYQFAESVRNIEKVKGNVFYNWVELVEWIKNIVKESREGLEYLLENRGIEIYNGLGRLVDKNKVLVEKEGDVIELETDKIILALGTVPLDIPIARFDGDKIISNREAFYLKEKPGSVLIVGGGVIGVELANIYSSLGVDVTIVELLEHILPFTDKDIAIALKQYLVQRKVRIFEKTTVSKIDKYSDRCLVELTNGERIEVDKVIVAIGRKPDTQNIGLENIGVEIDKKGFIKVNEDLETSVKNIYASGDVIGGPLLAHKALLESISIAKRIAREESFRVDYRLVPITIFTGLEIASIGYSEKDLQSINVKYVKYKIPLYYLSSVKIKGFKNAFIKILMDENSERIYGIHIVSPNASEVVSSYLPLIVGKLGFREARSIPYPHLTVSESLRDISEYIIGEPIHLFLKK